MSVMTNNVEHRNRVRTGKTAGQFAPEAHQEPTGVTLTQKPSPLDTAAVATVGDLVRTRDAVERGTWQRRHDKGHMRDLPTPPFPPVLVELNRQAQNFETLARDEQEAVLDQLKYPNAKHLLEPGQQLGNDKVQVAEDLDAEGGNLGLALTAQRLVADSGIPGTITLTKVGDYAAVFSIQDGNIRHGVRVGERALSFSANSGDENDYDRDGWLYRADTSTAGGSIFEKDRATELGGLYKSHREYAVMMDVVADSSFKEVNDDPAIGELDRSARTAELRVDGEEYLLDVSGDEPVLKSGGGKYTLHPSMTRGFLTHVAAETGHADGEAFASDLREVFRETDRRLIR